MYTTCHDRETLGKVDIEDPVLPVLHILGLAPVLALNRNLLDDLDHGTAVGMKFFSPNTSLWPNALKKVGFFPEELELRTFNRWSSLTVSSPEN